MHSNVAAPNFRTVETEPSILYFGTPVVLIGSTNEDDTFNLAPMSSAWWLGWRCLLGLASGSKTTDNLLRTRECVLNLPSAGMVAAVDKLARTTGSDPVPKSKLMRGYRHEKNKFESAGLTPRRGSIVNAPRALECPVQLEARVEAVHGIADGDAFMRGRSLAIEVSIARVHLDRSIIMNGDPNRVDPDKWRPLIMSFQQFYGLTPDRLQRSELAQIPEAMYRPPHLKALA